MLSKNITVRGYQSRPVARRLTNALLRKAAKAAERHSAVQAELSEAFSARYGCTYSDADADPIIDVLDYQGGELTVEQCDAIMADHGAPKLRRKQEAAPRAE